MSSQQSLKEKAIKEVEADNPQVENHIAITIEELRLLIAEKHELTIGVDDPILIMVTMYNAFLNEQQKVFDRHNAALAAFMGKTTDKYVEEVKGSIMEVNDSFRQISSNAINQTLREHVGFLGSFKQSLWWPAIIVATSAIVNLGYLIFTR